MGTKTIRTRIKHKIDNIDNWKSSAIKPLEGELVIAGNNLSGNTNNNPYGMKIGDGVRTWSQLPYVGQNIFSGIDCNSDLNNNNESLETINGNNLTIEVPIGLDQKIYAKYDFNVNDIEEFSIHVTGGNYMLSEHYILLNNKVGETGNKDRSFKEITIDGVQPQNILSQFDYVPSNDIMEVKISIYKIGETLHATVITKSGLDFRILSPEDETLDILTL